MGAILWWGKTSHEFITKLRVEISMVPDDQTSHPMALRVRGCVCPRLVSVKRMVLPVQQCYILLCPGFLLLNSLGLRKELVVKAALTCGQTF